MKKISLLLFSLLLGCSHGPESAQNSGAKLRGGGKSLPVTVMALARSESSGASVFLEPKDAEDAWTREDKRCVNDLYNALSLSGFSRAETAATAGLRILLDLSRPTQAKGFSFVAMMGGFKHMVSLEAKDKSGNLKWTIQASANHELNDRPAVFPSLALAMVGKFGASLQAEETVNVDEYDPRLDTINADSVPAPSRAKQ